MWMPYVLGLPLDNDLIFWSFWALGIVGFIGSLVAMVILLQRKKGRLTIIADAAGLHWHRYPQEPFTVVPWDAVRSFFRVGHQSRYNGTYVYFLVDAGEARLGWQILTNSKDDEYAELEQLGRIIVARSGKPLRNPSAAKGSTHQHRASWTGQPLLSVPAETRRAFKAANRRAMRKSWRWVVPMVLIYLLLAVSAFFLPQWVYDWQQSYFAGLAPQVVAAPLLYHNALTTPSADLPAIQPTAQNQYVQAGFANGAYTMTAPKLSPHEAQNAPDPIGGNSLTALLPRPYGNVAVAVTVQSTPHESYMEAGLVLRANGPNLLAFAIYPFTHQWSLYRYPATEAYLQSNPPSSDILATGASNAINSGAGVVNRLLAVVRDQVVLLYANGHYLGSFATSSVSGVFVRPASYNFGHPPIATSGKVGLFVGDESSAAFSDFSIYAISSPPALSYV
jgi:hypothetical protein